MMDRQDKQKLEELRAHVNCPKNYRCIHSALSELCNGKYHVDIDMLECLETSATGCEFARPFAGARVCTCALRKFIGKNLQRWSVESTAVLRQDEDGS